jgi:hypothetical protein
MSFWNKDIWEVNNIHTLHQGFETKTTHVGAMLMVTMELKSSLEFSKIKLFS